MALRFKIAKADYDKLSDELKGEYTLSGENATLDVDGGPDPKGSEKFESERSRRRAAEKRAKEAEEKLTELEDKSGDVAAMEAKHVKDLKKATDAQTLAEKKYSDFAAKSLKDGVANELATKLTKAPGLLKPHLLSRVTVDMTGDEPKTVILDKDGKPSAMKLEDLEKEFRDNKEFAAIIVGTHASGGGSSRQQSNGGNGLPSQPQQQRTVQADDAPLAAMKPGDLAATVAARVAARQAGRSTP